MNIYCARVVRIGEYTIPFLTEIPLKLFKKSPNAFLTPEVEVYGVSGELLRESRLTHAAIGATEDEAKRNLNRLGWRNYGKDIKLLPASCSDQPEEIKPKTQPNPFYDDATAERMLDLMLRSVDESYWRTHPRH